MLQVLKRQLDGHATIFMHAFPHQASRLSGAGGIFLDSRCAGNFNRYKFVFSSEVVYYFALILTILYTMCRSMSFVSVWV